jgi:large conductance mechanosensitive channel
VLKYGDFLGTVLDFLVVALVLFVVISKIVKSVEGRLSKGEAPTTKECKFCLETIPIKASRCKACASDV